MQDYFTDERVSVKEITAPRKITTTVRELDLSLFKRPSWRVLAESWSDIQEEEKLLKSRKEKLKTEIMNYAGGQEVCEEGMVVRKKTRKGSVDYSQVPELADVNLDPYRRQASEFWTIESVEVKNEN